MSTSLQFDYGVDSLVFENASDYPSQKRVEMLQVQDRTAGGTTHVETLGINIISRKLQFNLMSLTDYNALVDWFVNTVQGGRLPFDFTDEYGTTAEVRFVDNVLDFTEVSLNSYSGSFTLEYT